MTDKKYTWQQVVLTIFLLPIACFGAGCSVLYSFWQIGFDLGMEALSKFYKERPNKEADK